jgi:CubicO group peptidase (beta-lactamase class C family)
MDLSGLPADSFFIRTHLAPNIGGPENTATHEWRTAEIGAANGHGNARSVALAQSAITNEGTVKGKKLLSQSTIELAAAQQVEGTDLVLQLPIRFGLGFALSSPHHPVYEGRNVMYWSGFGGSRIIHLPDEGITFAYVMNKLQPGAILGEPRGDALFGALLASLAA